MTVVETARSQVGYRALPLKTQIYGVSGQDWNGAFVAWCFAQNGVRITPSTVELLARCVAQNRLYVEPKVGDVAFFAFPASGEVYGQPHVGIVTDVRWWKKNGELVVIEGQTSPESVQMDQTPNGVWQRVRYETDVLGFGRVQKFRVPPKGLPVAGTPPKISVSQIQFDKRHKAVEYLQLALNMVCNLREVERGVYDAKTRSALAAYQRRLGRTGSDATGVPDEDTLRRLGEQTDVFRI